MAELVATYRIHVTADRARARAEELALEQTLELPREAVSDARLLRDMVPAIELVGETGTGETCVRLRYPEAAIGDDPAQALGVLFGNASLLGDVRLESVELPTALREQLGGPRFGTAGWRSATGVAGRPLTCTALKPMGLDAAALAGLCRTFADAGLDVIKDDNGLADQPACRFEDRVRACARAIDESERKTGRRALYVPNVVGSPRRVRERLALVRELGLRAAMLQPMVMGLPAFGEAAGYEDLLLLAHPALAGGPRIAPAALLGSLFRAFGADAVIFPHAGGRFPFDETDCRDLAHALADPGAHLRPALPVPAGGMHSDRVKEIVDFYGRDCMLLVGGALYGAGADLAAAARGFVDAVARAADAAPGPAS